MPKPLKKTAIRKAKNELKPAAASKNTPKTTRANRKNALIVTLLGRTHGATVKELAAATSWQDHSVRGFLSGTLKKKLGFIVATEIVNGTRHYKIDRHGAGQ